MQTFKPSSFLPSTHSLHYDDDDDVLIFDKSISSLMAFAALFCSSSGGVLEASLLKESKQHIEDEANECYFILLLDPHQLFD